MPAARRGPVSGDHPTARDAGRAARHDRETDGLRWRGRSRNRWLCSLDRLGLGFASV